jgi:hypothetical protein
MTEVFTEEAAEEGAAEVAEAVAAEEKESRTPDVRYSARRTARCWAASRSDRSDDRDIRTGPSGLRSGAAPAPPQGAEGDGCQTEQGPDSQHQYGS